MKCESVTTSYKFYKSNTSAPVDDKTYRDLCAEYNKFLIEKVLKGKEVTLPARLGTLKIVGKRQKVRYNDEGKIVSLAPDWVKTKRMWENNPALKEKKQLVYCMNEHTGGVRYRYIWSKKQSTVENKTIYSLKLTRANKRAVNKMVTEGKEYLTTD